MTRIIHQTWKAADNIPRQKYPEAWQESWSGLHPEWEYRFWTDGDNLDLVETHYPEFLAGYRKIGVGVIKSDIARVLYLHRFGGMYADMDFACLRPFDDLVKALGRFILVGTHRQPRQPIPNAWLYAPAGDDFWLRMVDDALRDLRDGKTKIEAICGPDRLLWALDKYAPDHARLPYQVIYPFAWGVERPFDRDEPGYDWGNLDSLRRAFPQSLAVTSWAHNW